MQKRYKGLRIVCVIWIVLLSLVVALQFYMTMGYSYGPFRTLEKRADIERYAYTLGVNEVAYPLPSSSVDFFSCVYDLKLYFPYRWIAWKDETTYGGGEQVLQVYFASGEEHTINPCGTTSVLGREMGVVSVDGVAYVTDAWYCRCLSNLLSAYDDDRRAFVREAS